MAEASGKRLLQADSGHPSTLVSHSTLVEVDFTTYPPLVRLSLQAPRPHRPIIKVSDKLKARKRREGNKEHAVNEARLDDFGRGDKIEKRLMNTHFIRIPCLP